MGKKKPKRGRPPKDPAERHDAKPLYVKLTKADRELIEKAGYPEPSVKARELILRDAKRVTSRKRK